MVEAFTTRDFNDSSLVFVHQFHPLAKTLAEHHFPQHRYGRPPNLPERVLLSYMVQLASALRTIHRENLAARSMDITKIILTDKNRIRLSACSIVDVLNPVGSIEELQQEDLIQLGTLILSIATNIPPRNINLHDLRIPFDQLSRTYSQDLKDRISWLLSPPQPGPPKTAESLLFALSNVAVDLLESSLVTQDETMAYLGRELENGRLFRLMAKLGTINDRPEFDGDPAWSETGERYTIKLFRDYVFHQVDANGQPVTDLGHIITCLNKLDAGIDERVYLTSRDHQSAFVMSYKEIKKQIQAAFNDLQKGPASKQGSARTGFQ
jgi:PAB-dependent poly(A)-specific ribonuclease subunit 3